MRHPAFNDRMIKVFGHKTARFALQNFDFYSFYIRITKQLYYLPFEFCLSVTMFHRGRTTTTTRTTKPTLMTRLKGPNAKSKTVKTTTTTNPSTTHHTNKRHMGAQQHHTTATTPGISHRTNKRHLGPQQHHHKRKPTFGDKVSGAMMKMKGSITHRPGVKVSITL